MKDNKGFSLVEIIVVIAIMAVLTGVISISYRIVFGTNVKEFANNMQAELNSVRVSTMGKNNEGLHVYCDSDGAYYAQVVEYTLTTQADGSTAVSTTASGSAKKLGKKALTVTYSMDGGTSIVTLDSSHDFYVFYDRSSGAFSNNPATSTCCSDIWVEQGSHKMHLKLYKETGKVELQ